MAKRFLAALLLAAAGVTAGAANVAPTVGVTAPAAGTVLMAPATVTLSADATDSDGAVAKVEFFSGTNLLATVLTAPYTYIWNGAAPGTYTITAKATDNEDVATTSAAVDVTVSAGAGAAQAYYVHSDQINTPRLITDQAGRTVWQLGQEAFGTELPNENPAGLGTFTYNQRFPGQYFDRETGLHYNYFRDYDPQTGRYIESDPIGLNGGVNTYGYVRGNPISLTDAYGLKDVVVAIWTSRLVDGSVGHVFMGEMNGTTITSQFPTPHGIEGVNTIKSWPDTIATEGRDPDYVYKVNVPNDAAFDVAAENARRAPRWYAFPDGENSTHCAEAAARAMHAGGVKGIPATGAVWPNWLNSDLLFGSWFGNQVTRLPKVPF